MFGPLGADKYHEYCRDIHQSGQYLLDVINDVLDMSKIEAGRIRLDLEDGRARAVPRRRDARGLGARATTSSSTLTAADRAAASACMADRRALKQIVLNLLSNAVKFTPEGGRITVRGRARRRLRQHRHRGHRHRHSRRTRCSELGRPFEQVESQLTKSHHGSGLGLAIAKSLTELHGGTMRIRSTPGAARWCVVRLPIDRTSRAQAAKSPSAAAALDGRELRRARRRRRHRVTAR